MGAATVPAAPDGKLKTRCVSGAGAASSAVAPVVHGVAGAGVALLSAVPSGVGRVASAS